MTKRQSSVSSSGVEMVQREIAGDPSRFDESMEEAPQQSALEALLASLGGEEEGSKVTVFREGVRSGTKFKEYLYECAPSEFTFADLQSTYGGGRYRIQVVGPIANDQGKKWRGTLMNKAFDIGEPREKLKALPVVAQTNVAAEVVAALRPVMEQQQVLLTMLARGGDNNRAQIIEEMKAMAGFFQSRGPDPITMFAGLVPLIKSIMPKPGDIAIDAGESPEWAVLSKGIEIVQQMLANSRVASAAPQLPAPATAGAHQQPQMPVASASTAATSGASAPVAQSNEDEQMSLLFRSYLFIAIQAAKVDADVESYADLIATHGDEVSLHALETDPAWFTALEKLNAEVTPLKPWFEKLRARVVEMMNETESGDTAEPSHPV